MPSVSRFCTGSSSRSENREAVGVELSTEVTSALSMHKEGVGTKHEAVAIRLEAIASRLEAIASRLEAIAIRFLLLL